MKSATEKSSKLQTRHLIQPDFPDINTQEITAALQHTQRAIISNLFITFYFM